MRADSPMSSIRIWIDLLWCFHCLLYRSRNCVPPEWKLAMTQKRLPSQSGPSLITRQGKSPVFEILSTFFNHRVNAKLVAAAASAGVAFEARVNAVGVFRRVVSD